MSHRILLIDDEDDILEFIRYNLTKAGYEVYTARNGAEGLQQAAAHRPHLILLDMMMPVMDGIETCRALRRDPALKETMVVFLSALGEEEQQLAGFGAGADDYIPKPFRPRELLARVASTIRRSQPSQRIVRFGDLTVDTDRAHVERRGREIVLSALEYRLLLLFATNPGRLVTREMMRDALWDDAGTYIEENTLSVYIKRLRDKIEEDPSDPRLIQTVRGLGYKALG